MKKKKTKLSLQHVQIVADPRDYFLLWLKDIPEDCDRGFVGVIRNASNQDIEINIEIDDNWMMFNRKRGIAIYIDPQNYVSGCVIVITKETFDQLYHQQKGLPGLWHEVGHFHTTKYFLDYLTNNQEQKRHDYIQKWSIPPAEYVADLFALYYCDREQVFDYLKSCIRSRFKMIDYDENAKDGWNELRMRRNALRKIETDQAIEAEFCRVCGVKNIDNL